MNKTFDHIGIALRSLDDGCKFYIDHLGAILLKRYTSETPGVEVHVAVIELGGQQMELMEPTNKQSPIATFLKLKGKGVHHIAYRVDDLDEAIVELKNKGLRFLEDTYRTNPLGRRLIYMNPVSSEGTLIELCDYPNSDI